MPKGYSLEYNDFSGGLNTRLPASQIARNEAQVAVNVDLRSGALKSIKDLGTAVTTGVGASLHYAASAFFMDDYTYTAGNVQLNPDDFYRFYLDDGDVTYYTNPSSYPQRVTAIGRTSPEALGVVPPDPPTITKIAGSLTGRFKYALTFFTSDDVESNPTFFADVSLSSQGIQFTLPQAKNGKVVGARLYRTRSDEDVYFLIKETLGVSTSTSSITVSSDQTTDGDIDVESQLTWAQGGFPSSGGQYIEDHSPPPPLTVLSNRLHAGNTTGRPGAGIVFGASGSDIRWSILGAPDYWPVLNQAILPGVCEALISVSGTTFAFTATGIFQLIGTSDDAISVTQTNAAHGVKPGTGHLVTDTPFGMMYQSPEGIALFNGSSSTIISAGKLALSTIEAYTYKASAFYDNQLFLFHSAGALIADFQDGVGGVRFWNYTSTGTVKGATVATFDAPTVAQPFASPLGYVSEVVIVDGGSGYTTLPTGSVSAPRNGAAVAVSFTGSVDRVDITNAGTGYTAAPTVTFSSPTSGTTAKGVAFIVNGQVVSVEITDPGNGYTSPPTITLTGGGGSSFASTVSLSITGARVTQTGFGFATFPRITLASGVLATGGRNASVIGVLSTLGLYQHGAVRVGTKLFLFGGLAYTPASIDGTGNVGLNVLKYGQYYDTTTNTWTAMPVMPTAMHSFTPVTDGTNIYLYAGATTTANTGGAQALYRYNVGANTWTTLAPSYASAPNLTQGYAGHAAWMATISGTTYLYVWGGFNAAGNTDVYMWRYNVTTNAWEELSTASPFQPPYAYAAVALNTAATPYQQVFVIGGRDTNATTKTYTGGQTDLPWYRVSLLPTFSSTSITTLNEDQVMARDSARAITLTVSGTVYALLYGGQFISATDRITLSSIWVIDMGASAGSNFVRQVENVSGLGELWGHTLTSMSDNSVVVYGGVGAGTIVEPLSTGSKFFPQGLFDLGTTTTLYVAETISATTGVKPWAQGSTYLPMQWRGREETAPLPGVRHTMTRFRIDYEGQPQFSIFASGTEEPGGGSFFFNPSSSASRTQARQWLPSASTTRPDGTLLSLQFKSPSAAGNDTVVYRFEVDGKYDGS